MGILGSLRLSVYKRYKSNILSFNVDSKFRCNKTFIIIKVINLWLKL